MTEAPTLSICVPTFNRRDLLRETLSSILPAAKRLGVEVCVSNNKSTDGTEDYLRTLEQEFRGVLTHVTQAEHTGIDRNMMSVICMGRGRYIYPIGDDDVLADGAIESLLAAIEDGPDVLILNGWHTDAELTPQREHLVESIKGLTFSEPADAFAKLWDKMPFGSFLAERGLFAQEYFYRYLGTSHAYTGAVWDALADKHAARRRVEIHCMSAPTVYIRGAQKSWAQNSAEIFLKEIPHWFNLLAEIPVYQHVVSGAKSKYQRNWLRTKFLIRLRANGHITPSNVGKLSGNFSKYQRVKMAVIAALPKKIAKLLK